MRFDQLRASPDLYFSDTMPVSKSGLKAGLSEKPSRPDSVDENTLNEDNEILKEEREATRAAINDPVCKDDEFPGDIGCVWDTLLAVYKI